MAVGNDRSSFGRNSSSCNRATPKALLLCVMALGTLLPSTAFPQVLEGTILLPDSLGPLYGKNHVAFDEDSAHPRIFIGGEGGDVIVANSVTCERFARVRSSPMNALCYVPAHNKLYVSTTDEYGIAVVDCSSYEVIKRLSFSSLVTGLYYNPVNDRVYCATDPLKIVDCTIDSVVDSVAMNATDAKCALDGTHNKLYVSAKDSLQVVDCVSDSVVGRLFGPRDAQAICFQPSAGKVYAAAGESLFAVNTATDSVVYRQWYDTLDAQLACDPVHNRVYYTYWGWLIALDCATDSVIWSQSLWARAIGLAPVPAYDKLYATFSALGAGFCRVIDGSTGQVLRGLFLATEYFPCYCPAADRVFAAAQDYEVAWIDCDADSICGGIPLSMKGAGVYNMCVDSVHDKLYFCRPNGGARGYVGVVDCATNKVTSYLTAFEHPSCLTYNHVDNKLYVCSYDSCIFVYDCTYDTVLKTLHTDGRTVSMYTHPDLSKLYAVASSPRGPSDSARIHVIDLVSNSTLTTVGLAALPGASFLAPELNQFWAFYGGYTVVDCLNDSIVMDTTPPWYFGHASPCYNPMDRRVYAISDYGSGGDSVFYVVDMDTRLTVDSIPVQTRLGCVMLRSAVRAHKVYGLFQGLCMQDSVFVVDGRSDSIVRALNVPAATDQMSSDRSGDYMYLFCDTLTVVDTRTDSVVNHVELSVPPMVIVNNGSTNRLYLAGYHDTIQVVYDSVVTSGLDAEPSVAAQDKRLQTFFGRSQPLRRETGDVLFDASGRRVVNFGPGGNDAAHLPPGVYFLRGTEPQLSAQPVRKIVIAE